MSLDNLISKYLDGELNQEEDILLRHYLADDKAAKEEFDVAVELNHAMKKDAQSIKVPVDLLSETEDRIMMQIINESKANVLKLELPKKSKFNYRYISAAAVILFMFAIGKISDHNLGTRFDNVAESYRDEFRSVDKNIEFSFAAENNVLVLVVPKEEVKQINKSSIEMSNSDGFVAMQAINSDKPLVAQTFDENLMVQSILAANDIESDEDYNDYATNNPYFNAQSNTLLKEKRYDAPQMPSIIPQDNNGSYSYYDDFQYQMPNNVNITFFGSSDFSSSGFNKTSNSGISNYSLSVAYNIVDNFDMGIEIGNLNFLSNMDITVRVPRPASNSMIEVGNKPTDFIEYHRTVNIDNSLFWVSAFAEHNIISATEQDSWLNLSARFGFGASNSGSLFYGRVRGKVELYNNFYLTLGTELRFMSLNFGENFGGSNWSRAGFVVYGLEYYLR
jgi:hypothetical protein